MRLYASVMRKSRPHQDKNNWDEDFHWLCLLR